LVCSRLPFNVLGAVEMAEKGRRVGTKMDDLGNKVEHDREESGLQPMRGFMTSPRGFAAELRVRAELGDSDRSVYVSRGDAGRMTDVLLGWITAKLEVRPEHGGVWDKKDG